MNTRFLLLFLLGIAMVSIAGRLLPHPPNFAPIAALALFAGVYASKISKWYLVTPLAAMFASDLFLGFYDLRIMAVVYASFFAVGLVGLLVRLFEAKLQTVVLGTIGGSVLFYLTTNFAVWAFSGIYAPTLNGLLLSYYMALPFFKFTLFGDLFYTGLFFGVYEFARAILFPLCSSRRFGGDIVENAGDLGDFVGNAPGEMRQKVIGEPRPVRGHNI